MTILHFYDKPFNVRILRSRLQQAILSKLTPVPEVIVTDAINSCKKLFNQTLAKQGVPKEYSEVSNENGQEAVKTLYHDLLFHNGVQQRLLEGKPSLLTALFKGPLVLDFEVILPILKNYVEAKKGKLSSDEIQAIYVFVRERLENRQITQALDIVDVSVGSEVFLNWSRRKWWSRGLLGCLSMLSFQLPVYFVLPPEFFFSYMSLYWGSVAYIGTQISEGTERLKFVGGKLYRNLVKQEQLTMVNRIIEEYDDSFNLNIRNYHYSHALPYDYKMDIWLRQALAKRGFQLKPLKEHTMYQEYWQTAGQGYTWVEPDQDPIALKKPPQM
jgi:hypothetical protein